MPRESLRRKETFDPAYHCEFIDHHKLSLYHQLPRRTAACRATECMKKLASCFTSIATVTLLPRFACGLGGYQSSQELQYPEFRIRYYSVARLP